MTTVGVSRYNPVSEFADAGRFFAGDVGPPIDCIFEKTSGGLYSLAAVNGVLPIIEGAIRRFDAQRKTPIGAIITEAILTILDQTQYLAWAEFDWLQAGPISSVPNETGWYILQCRITPPDGRSFSTQRAVFYVEPSFGF